MYQRLKKAELVQLKPVYPVDEWPIYELTKNQKAFLEGVISDAAEKVIEHLQIPLDHEISKTIYQEKIRLTRKAWKADKKNEPIFWERIQNKLLDGARTETESKELLFEILDHYAHEIVGVFNPRTYRLSERLVPALFTRFLNASTGKNIEGIFGSAKNLHDKIQIRGDVHKIRELTKQGTVIILPTHFSNLDSLLIGWVIHAIGLPAFTYGAGLNLFSIRLLSFFMNRLGAYKVDRRKKGMIYLQTLKSYSQKAIEQNCHSLFFPGGTRSRSGAMEKNLKLGLLGSAMDAQYGNIINAKDGNFKKIYVVPAVLNYNFVLEAPALIKNYLLSSNRHEALIENDAYSTSYNIGKFLTKFFTVNAEIVVSFGECMDLLGNSVNAAGESISKHGRVVDIKEYFVSEKKLHDDEQRNRQYTHLLSERILENYYKFNVVMATQLIAFAAFKTIQNKFKDLDLYALLRLPKDDCIIDEPALQTNCTSLLKAVVDLHRANKVDIDQRLSEPLESLIEYGVKNLGQYHQRKPLRRQRKSKILYSEDLRLLYYYHNRLEGYNLDEYCTA